MKNAVLLLISASLLWWSCGGGSEKPETVTTEAKGGVVYGGVFKMNEVEDFRSLFPLNITEVTSHRITNQIYEGLVRFNQADLSVEPSLAESWDVNDAGTQYTFKLRKGIRFHADSCFLPEKQGREVTANDFKYCFDLLCTAMPENQLYWLFENKVAGAAAHYQATVEGQKPEGGVAGIKVIDDYTLQINLEHPVSGFLKVLAQPGCWVFPKEAFELYGEEMRSHCVGTGPFIPKTVKEGQAIVLSRNNNYWRKDAHGNQLPYLHAVKVSFLKEKKTELLEFRKGNLDMVFRLPIEMIGDVLGTLEEAKRNNNPTFDIQVKEAYGIEYFGFNHTNDLFKDERVRKAFNLAIDRERFVTYVLQGDGIAATEGIVPPGFKGYPYDKVKGYDFDPELARKLMADAGYPNGNGFPKIKLQINSGGENNIRVAAAIQSMLSEHIGVDVALDIMPMAEHYEKVETGNAVFWRTAWLADYPDPENFINLLYGGNVPEDPHAKAYLNSERFINAQYDSLFEAATQEIDEAKRMELLRQADQIQLDKGAIIPLFYNEFTRLLHQNVRNFPQNSMEYRDLSEVYFKEKDAAPAPVGDATESPE